MNIQRSSIELSNLVRKPVPLEEVENNNVIRETRLNKNDSVSVIQWTNEILRRLNEAKEKGELTNALIFSYEDFPPDQIHQYKILQESIAAIIPNEYERPTIQLEIKGSKPPLCSGDRPDLGLLGGTGPLSDAHIITKIIEKNKDNLDHIYIKLRSAPPPRLEERQFSIKAWVKHLWNYAWGVNSFGSSQCNHYAMLSNTAHSNADNFTKMLDRPNRFIHLVNHIAGAIAQDKPSNVLVLGTADAAEKRLYPNALKKEGASGVLPNISQKRVLQSYIDHVKSGTLTQERGAEFVKLIFDEIKKVSDKKPGEPSHVIFGCTEIPLFLETRFKDSKGREMTYHDLLKEKMQQCQQLNDVKIKFVDSEHAMVEVLDQHQKKVIQHKLAVMVNLETPKKAIAESGEEFEAFKLAVSQGIQKYAQVAFSFFNLIFGLKEEGGRRAVEFHHKVADCTSLSSLKTVLNDFFSKDKGGLNDSSLKTNILESVLGSLSQNERNQFSENIKDNNFGNLAERFLSLRASHVLSSGADITPGSIVFKNQDETAQGISKPRHCGM